MTTATAHDVLTLQGLCGALGIDSTGILYLKVNLGPRETHTATIFRDKPNDVEFRAIDFDSATDGQELCDLLGLQAAAVESIEFACADGDLLRIDVRLLGFAIEQRDNLPAALQLIARGIK